MPYYSPRTGKKYAQRAGGESGWIEGLLAPFREKGEEVRYVPAAVLALAAFLGVRLSLYVRDTAGRRAAAWERVRKELTKLGPIRALERLGQPVYPAPFPVLTNQWLLNGELLFVAVAEAVLTKPGLGAISDYAGDTEWLVAGLIGLLLVVIIFVTGKALAYVIQHPDHRNSEEYRLVFWTMTGLAIFSFIFTLAVAVYLKECREENEAKKIELKERGRVASETGGLSGVSTAPAAGQPSAADDPLEDLQPNLTFTLVLQLAGIIAGLIVSTIWNLGGDYRRDLKVAARRRRAAKKLAKAREPLDVLSSQDMAVAQAELDDAEFRNGEFHKDRQRSAAEAGQPPPEATPLPNPSARLHAFRSMTGTAPADLVDMQIELIQRQTLERLTPAADQGEHAAETEGHDTASNNGSGPTAHVPPPGEQHHN